MKPVININKTYAVALVMAVLLCILAYAVYTTYDAYTEMVVQQQQQQLLVVSRAVSQNLDLFLSEQIRDVEILVSTPGFGDEFKKYYDFGNVGGVKEYIISYMLSHHQGLSRVYLLDRRGNEVFRYNQYPFLEEFDESALNMGEFMRKGQTGMGPTFPIGEKKYGVALINMVYRGDDYLGCVVGIIDLADLYKLFVLPLDTRESDNIIVKDRAGTVLMHPNKDIIGFNPMTDLGDLNSDARYGGMKRMLERQYEYEEGMDIYRAYYGGVLAPVDEISAFTRMNLGGESWFISAVMPVEKALQPVNENLGRFGFLVSAILAILVMTFIIIYVLQKKRQHLKLQTRYLKDINYTLEELHQSREQVRHYQKLQTIGALAGGIAHEFNNLLTPILGYCQFLKQQMGPDSAYYEDLDEIHKAGNRAKEIVEQILPLSRRETDEAVYVSLSLDAVIRDALRMVRMIIPSTIHMDEKVGKTGANVYGSATQLNQVLLNLCINAYQSMEQDGGTLTVRSRPVPPSQLPDPITLSAGDMKSYIAIIVEDTGCGMSPELLEQIFDPFFTTKDIGEGTGLGLSIVQNILASHGGFVEVESEVNKGSRFTVYLPTTDIPVSQSHIKGAVPNTANRKALSLLLVDDEVQVVNYLRKRLVQKGYEIDSYTSPEQAIAAFSQTPEKWDLLIVDYTMPKYKGTTMARQLKNLRPDLPVLLITGLVENDALQMKQEKVLNDILIKPIDFDELLQTINRLVN